MERPSEPAVKKMDLVWPLLLWGPLAWLFSRVLPYWIGVALAILVVTLLLYRLPRARALHSFWSWAARCFLLSLSLGLLNYVFLKLFGIP